MAAFCDVKTTNFSLVEKFDYKRDVTRKQDESLT